MPEAVGLGEDKDRRPLDLRGKLWRSGVVDLQAPKEHTSDTVVVADDEDRENEGDLVCAAASVTPLRSGREPARPDFGRTVRVESPPPLPSILEDDDPLGPLGQLCRQQRGSHVPPLRGASDRRARALGPRGHQIGQLEVARRKVPGGDPSVGVLVEQSSGAPAQILTDVIEIDVDGRRIAPPGPLLGPQ